MKRITPKSRKIVICVDEYGVNAYEIPDGVHPVDAYRSLKENECSNALTGIYLDMEKASVCELFLLD